MTELSIYPCLVESSGVVLLRGTAVLIHFAGRRNQTIHDLMKSPPEMLQIPNKFGFPFDFGQMVVDMETATVVRTSPDVFDDVEGRRQGSLNLFPGHWSRLGFDLAPPQSYVLGFITQRHIVLDGKLAARRDRLSRVASGEGLDSLVGEDFGDEALDITVFADADDRNNDFDFNSDSSRGVDGCLHTTHYRAFAERANRFQSCSFKN